MMVSLADMKVTQADKMALKAAEVHCMKVPLKVVVGHMMENWG